MVVALYALITLGATVLVPILLLPVMLMLGLLGWIVTEFTKER